MKLELERELTESRFADVGRPYGVFRDDGWQILGICSGFAHYGWPGRMANEGQRLFNRLSLYSSGDNARIAVLDTHYPINDVAFHPTKRRIAVATGSYDGGYFFFGELILWDWGTDEYRSLLVQSREVVRCRFDGEKIAFLIRPTDDDTIPNADDTYYGLIIDPAEETPHTQNGFDLRLKGLEPCDPSKIGFDRPPLRPGRYWLGLSESEESELRERGFEERHTVRDVLWLNDQTFAAVHNKCLVEIWDVEKGRQEKFTGVGHGIQLLRQPEEGCLVHVFHDHGWPSPELRRSSLYAFSDGSLTLHKEFDHAASFSIDSAGNVLGRHLGVNFRRDVKHQDVVIGSEGQTLIEKNLGHFDAINHFIEGRELPALFFLRGTPPDSNKNKVLCTVDSQAKVRELLQWDDVNIQRFGALCVLVSAGEMIRALREYLPPASLLQRLSIETGELSWSIPLEGSTTSLTHLPEVRCVAFAQANGTLGLVDTDSGEILSQFRLMIDEIPTIPTALAARGNRLLVGTIDGRILLYRVHR